MRRWRCQRTSALLEGESLVILTVLEDDEWARSDLIVSRSYGRGITESQAKKLLDELEYKKEREHFYGIDLWDYFDNDEDYWGEEYYLPEWYEDERYQW